MTIRRTLVGVCAFASLMVAGAALAQNEGVIDARKKLFKEIGSGAEEIGDVMKGKKAFDQASVQKTLRLWSENAGKLTALFPDDSKVGTTRALPRVWEEKVRFVSLLDGFSKDSAAAATAFTDQASLNATMPKLFGDCKGCHDDFRAKRP